MSNQCTNPSLETSDVAVEDVRLLEARAVPLGGLRAIKVDRLLPHRTLPTVGAWCFLDRFGPQHDDMTVLPHPHTGLQTVTWPFAGEVRHRDSLGSDVLIKPGQLNLMTAGRGISHSEFSLGDRPLLDGLQLWLALPAAADAVAPSFEQHADLPVFTDHSLRARVFIGSIGDVTSPATTYSPLVGADFSLAPGDTATVPLRTDFEHALVVVDGSLAALGHDLPSGPMLYLGTNRDHVTVTSDSGARAILLGGAPYEDDLVMWWNFVGRSHDDIAAARAEWEDGDRFGVVRGHDGARIPAPPLPGVRLTPRRRR
ncbi:pirin family protein [Kutzneria chonburiensis]|uniref:Pirin family protein n=1 Tax=Kutzneria chonburiensis TaxID=1483604 RepID=A0ABV6N6U3_9PSEU|nr:pirin family protein [Kutzneria chonburiensis]